MLKVKLTTEIINKINNGCLKTVEIITHITQTNKDVITTKPLPETALKDLIHHNKAVINAKIDMWQNEIILFF